jgi:hypothetical protein
MPATLSTTEGVLTCSCGAKCKPGAERRFRERHPKLCSERHEFARQLAQGTRSVDADEPSTLTLGDLNAAYMLAEINERGRNLTVWEQDFISSIGTQEKLSPRQLAVLAKIHASRI